MPLPALRLGILLRLTVFLIVGLTTGIGSARWLIAQSANAVPISVGAWKIWPEEDQDSPYGTAHYLLAGRLPPAVHQVNVYETERDDEGRLLDAACVYTLTGPAQSVRWWEIAIIDPLSGPVFPGNAPMSGTSSAQIISAADGTFTLTIAREPKPGNWISPGELTHFGLAMSLRFARLHETIEPAEALPRIARGACA